MSWANSSASILDLERLLSKISLASAGPRDVGALARSLAVVPLLKKRLAEVESARLRDIDGRLDEIAEVRDGILTALADELPVNLADGGAIRDGFDVAARRVARHFAE